MKIIPMRDLKDTVKIEALCEQTKAPVFVTKNGYGKLVVMDIDTFERIMNGVYEARLVNDGLADLEEGRIQEASEVLESMKKKYGF